MRVRHGSENVLRIRENDRRFPGLLVGDLHRNGRTAEDVSNLSRVQPPIPGGLGVARHGRLGVLVRLGDLLQDDGCHGALVEVQRCEDLDPPQPVLHCAADSLYQGDPPLERLLHPRKGDSRSLLELALGHECDSFS